MAQGSRAWHLVTCEYPPAVGGVADFTRVVAGALAVQGPVHVWAPAPAAGDEAGIVVHELRDGFSAAALPALDRALEACAAPRRLFVQWVPHGYGYKSLNLPFCFWIRRRARRGDEVHLMVHEPFLPFDLTRLRQNAGALVHRLMLRLLLGAAARVWVSTPSFSEDVRRFAPRPLDAVWLPIPSPVPRVDAPETVRRMRAALAGDGPVVGYFGTCNALVAPTLSRAIARLSAARPGLRFVLAGRGTDAFARALVANGGVSPAAIVWSGEAPATGLSQLLQCCDVFVQPYHDGASARRTTLMALLAHGAAVVSAAGRRTEGHWTMSGALRIVPRADPDMMASAVLALLDDPAERLALGTRARALYDARFDIRHVQAKLLDAVAA